MSNQFDNVFFDTVDSEHDLEVHEEPFGSQQFFIDQYNEKVEGMIKDFLFSNLESIFQNENEDSDLLKEKIGNLVDVYYVARTEFDKHKSKLKLNNRFRSYL